MFYLDWFIGLIGTSFLCGPNSCATNPEWLRAHYIKLWEVLIRFIR